MGQWRVYIQPPRQGASHKKRGNTQCQDMAEVRESDDIVVAVLADGLGELEYSGIAAATVTNVISEYLLSYDYSSLSEQRLKEDILCESRSALNAYSDQLNINVYQMDCTLLFVVLLKDGSKFIYGQLGDGAICVVKPNQGLQMCSFDDNYRASSNMVKTVLSSDANTFFNLRVCSAVGLVGFFLTTDGLENEIYSKAGKVKKKIEWYFNLVSNNEESVCRTEIQKRWDDLTSDEGYGFTDDMSLIAIVKSNQNIELPEDATWLCVCGNRNRMESTRCENCKKDFTKIYKGINFRQIDGGKLAFFRRINGQPQEELRVLQEHCEYPIEFDMRKYDKVFEDTLGNTDAAMLAPQTVQQQIAQDLQQTPISAMPHTVADSAVINNVNAEGTIQGNRGSNPLHQHQEAPVQIKSQNKKTTDVYTKQADKKKRSGKFNILTCLCLLFTFIRRRGVHFLVENNTLRSENKSLLDIVDTLSREVVELKEIQNKSMTMPYDYEDYIFSTGDVYIGQLSRGLPNGMGVIYSSDVLMAGNFLDEKKNGDFLFLYADGHSEIRTFEMDRYIPETHMLLQMMKEGGADGK